VAVAIVNEFSVTVPVLEQVTVGALLRFAAVKVTVNLAVPFPAVGAVTGATIAISVATATAGPA